MPFCAVIPIFRLIVGTFLGALAMTGTLAPRVEIYTKLTCQVRHDIPSEPRTFYQYRHVLQELRPDFDAILIDPGSAIGSPPPIGWPSPFGTLTIPRPSQKCQADPQVQVCTVTPPQ